MFCIYHVKKKAGPRVRVAPDPYNGYLCPPHLHFQAGRFCFGFVLEVIVPLFLCILSKFKLILCREYFPYTLMDKLSLTHLVVFVHPCFARLKDIRVFAWGRRYSGGMSNDYLLGSRPSREELAVRGNRLE